MPPQLIYFAYARKSKIDPKTRKEIESTDRQADRITAWAAEQGVAIELFAEPDGYRSGGSTEHRPAYLQMVQRLEASKPGDIAGVVVTEIDRAGRRESDLHKLFDLIIERGLRLVVLNDPSLSLGSTDGRFMAGLKALLAAQERHRMSDRIRAALADKQARGYYVGAAPYGYRYCEQIGPNGHKVRTLMPDPVEAERVVAILEKYLVSSSIDVVARWCNALGWPAGRGGPWAGASVYEMLERVPAYRGFVLTRDDANRVRAVLPGNHPPIISEELAAAVEATRRQRAMGPRAGRKGSVPYPLVHLAVCAVCGSTLVGATRNGLPGKPFPEPQLFYRCSKFFESCDVQRMAAVPLEEQLWSILDRFRAMLRAAARSHDRARLPAPRPLPEPNAAGAIRAEMDRLTLVFTKGRISEERYDQDYAALEDRLAAAIATVETIGSPADPLGLLAVENMMAPFDVARAVGDRAALAEIARLMVERVEVCRGDIVRCTLIPMLEQSRSLLDELE